MALEIDLWLPERMRASALLLGAEADVEAAVRKAIERWLAEVRRLVLGTGQADAVTADAAPPPNMEGFAASEPEWAAALAEFAMPVLEELFAERFLAIARIATVSDQPYREAYIAEVFSRLKLFPAEQFEEIRPEIQEAISEGETIDQVRDRIAAVLDFDTTAGAQGEQAEIRRVRGRIVAIEKRLDDPTIDPAEAAALRAARRELYDDLYRLERRWQWKARRIARTETIGALNGGSYWGARARADILDLTLYKQWLATDDARTRPTHRAADGQVRRLATSFLVGGAPSSSPACRAAPRTR
ncbi:Phage Mu protein F like protein [Microbispora rosea]|uniref:Phage Mu protein F like protein n=1 Tax=Microbispora rosea TaxID=58117 RepID=A0A1N7GJ25_9ACTN|nr:phage minor head protein [Microbispora rosea]GIH51682.1 hypothetical protein Mro03_68610 [Microbispora rosea subsp. rosea]SIS12587.1 Phage Mu protein F like protein [Microbispora rosea]